MRRQSRCCQVSTFAPLASWLTRTMLSFRDLLHYACWRLVNDVSLSYLMFITLEKTLFQVWKIFLFPGSRKVSLVLVALGYSCYVFTPRYACLFWILVVITNSLDKKNCMCTRICKCISFNFLRQSFPWRGFSWFIYNYHLSVCIQVHVHVHIIFK